jgi:putative membrane protein
MKKLHIVLLAIWTAVFLWSAVNPADRATWYMEVAPAVIGLAILIATYKSFKFTDIAYMLLTFFCCYIMIGGKYTYAEVPIGNYLKEIFDLSRNHYDRVGHFFQGVIPALTAREIIIRTTNLKKGKMLFFICVCVAMFVSSGYEIIEWLAAELTANGAAEFLGLQGDVWDAQKDMLMALLGATTSLLILSKNQDMQIARLK